MELTPGMRVRCRTTRGSFEGTVERLITVREYLASQDGKSSPGTDFERISQAVLRPVSPAVREYIGDDGMYRLGRAHWDTCIRVLPVSTHVKQVTVNRKHESGER
jgi:hypothetical protein